MASWTNETPIEKKAQAVQGGGWKARGQVRGWQWLEQGRPHLKSEELKLYSADVGKPPKGNNISDPLAIMRRVEVPVRKLCILGTMPPGIVQSDRNPSE